MASADGRGCCEGSGSEVTAGAGASDEKAFLDRLAAASPPELLEIFEDFARRPARAGDMVQIRTELLRRLGYGVRKEDVRPLMRWYARPEGDSQQLRVAPRLASWNKADDPDQVRLRAYLEDTEALLAASRVDGTWALRLDVGLPTGRDLLNMADLDNYAYPLAYRLRDSGLVSVWCTKQHSEHSFVRIEAACEMPTAQANVLIATTTASPQTVAYKEQIQAAVAGESGLAAGPIRLELAFVVGPRRNWLNLWKQTIDSLDPLLGRTYPDRAWNPLDGRITELGMHVTVDHALGNDVVIGIAAAPA